MAERLQDERLALAGCWLVGLHAATSLHHHPVRHDDTLVRMSLSR